MKSGIYKITNEVTGKFYIGSAKDIDWRWYEHKRDLKSNKHCNPKLQHSWNSHGETNFAFIILEEIIPDQQKLFEREQYYLDKLKPYERNIGYNISPKADGGDNITHHPNRDAFIEKMKMINHGENNGMFGKTHSEEAIQKQKDKSMGRYTLKWFVDRYGIREGKKKFIERRLMLKNRKMNYSHPNVNKGKVLFPMSNEAKEKLTDTKMRMKEIRPLVIKDIQSDLYTTKFIAEKYNIGITAVKYYKQKLHKEGKL